MRKLFAALAVVVTCVLSVSTAAADPVRLSLPAPTGHAAVGRATFALVDRERPDPWVPDAGPRRLMVTLYYPAVRGTGRPAPYMDITESTALVDFAQLGPEFTAERLAGTRTWSRTHAHPLPGRPPLVLLSPGFIVPRHTLTALAEDLASRGYVAAFLDDHVRGIPQRLLAGPSPEFPEITSHQP